jgi:hypothetical protein
MRGAAVFDFYMFVMDSFDPTLFNSKATLTATAFRPNFYARGFSEIWAVDFSDAYVNVPRRTADMFCSKPASSSGFLCIGSHDRSHSGNTSPPSSRRLTSFQAVGPPNNAKFIGIKHKHR